MVERSKEPCPICGGWETVETVQSGYGSLSVVGDAWHGAALYHTVCLGCGTVLRSYVKDPQMLLKKKDRKGGNRGSL